jgi:phosphoglucosamine mutase
MAQRVEFGADGIRGIAGHFPIDRATVPAIGKAFAIFARHFDPHPTVVVGRDTRPSGPWIKDSLIGGLLAQGAHVMDLGVMTTPCVAYLLRRAQADMGLVVSASHSPHEYNGIKVLGPGGLRLQREQEMELEVLCEECLVAEPRTAPRNGEYTEGRLLINFYVREHVRFDWSSLGLAAAPSLAGFRVVLDCADGAASVVAPRVFAELGAAVRAVHDSPDGSTINYASGSEHARRDPALLAALANEHGAGYAFAFDGDGDRLVVVDRAGRVYDGNDLLYALARVFAARGLLRSRTVVTSPLANGGLASALAALGIKTLYVSKGDRNVEQAMWSGGHFLGGEEGGNIIINDGRHTAADALYTALALALVLQADGVSLRALTEGLVKHRRVTHSFKLPWSDALFQRLKPLLWQAQVELGEGSRALLWPASTEPGLMRLLIEGGPDTSLERVEQAALLVGGSLEFAARDFSLPWRGRNSDAAP